MIIDKLSAQKMMPLRENDSHKGTYGTVLIIGGSLNMPGALCLAALGALRSGPGLVKAAFPDVIYNAVTAHLTETVFLPLPANENGMLSSRCLSALERETGNASAVVIGCGMGISADTVQITQYVIETVACPVIIDADALNCVSKKPDMLSNTAAKLILTPHPGEMARLIRRDTAFINKNRENVAKEFAQRYGVTLLLKGYKTVIANKNGDVRTNITGNSGLAKGGSGDLLSGIMGALAANINEFDAAALAAYLHGLAADYAAKEHTEFCVTPTVCADYLSKAFKSLII
ncbi:MAG: Bifunctional NAD(P)H-hydrate repair enzyme Nnr [Firmicutes bacterium ADurb.Bin300]|nr:MAG: Bifunctional NAD(P)H-hydrate repair enzyme Nnr [Firmicutes bacterium ADurb.Bin300]